MIYSGTQCGLTQLCGILVKWEVGAKGEVWYTMHESDFQRTWTKFNHTWIRMVDNQPCLCQPSCTQPISARQRRRHRKEEIGRETAAAYKSILADFVGAMPDIANSSYKAEYWSFWMIHLALILLRGHFPNNKYYRHMIDFVSIIKLCLQFTITEQELAQMEELIIDWVEKYE
ncbi:hypothetical protein K439DRAFT_348013 [Ramaria rubella]|nr:hypothetical protein K439DRAFT_348013 [Ramaria rubella]